MLVVITAPRVITTILERSHRRAQEPSPAYRGAPFDSPASAQPLTATRDGLPLNAASACEPIIARMLDRFLTKSDLVAALATMSLTLVIIAFVRHLPTTILYSIML